MSPLVSATGLTKSFVVGRNLVGRPTGRALAVRNVDLELGHGETLAVVGESGAGKSTLGRLILRLIEPDEGRVVLNGIDVLGLRHKELRVLRKRMQMVFQDPFSSLDPKLPVHDAVSESLSVHFGLKGEDRRQRATGLLDRVGISAAQMDRYPHEFSGGQLQRIAIARALAVEPDLIVCDEPVAALDVSIRAQVINLLRDLQQERGVAYIFVSHDLSLVRVIADRVAVMYRGEVVEQADAARLFAAPMHPYTRALLDVVPVPDPRRRGERRLSDDLPTPAGIEPPAAVAEGTPMSGCAYASRCPSVMSVCQVSHPTLRQIDGRMVRCHLYQELPVAPNEQPAVLGSNVF